MKKDLKQILYFLVCAACLVAADQAAKSAAVRFLKGKDPLVLLPGVLEFSYVENRGAAFGMLQQRQVFFFVMTICALLIIAWLFLFRIPSSPRFTWMNLACLLVFSGAVGNFIDRLRQGYVVDLIYVRLIDFPVFNLADCYISVASAGLSCC